MFSGSDDGTIRVFEASSQELLTTHTFYPGVIGISTGSDHLYLSQNSQSLVYSMPEYGSGIIFDNKNKDSLRDRFMCPTTWSLHGILMPHQSEIVNGYVLALCPQAKAMVPITDKDVLLHLNLGFGVYWLNGQINPVKEASVFVKKNPFQSINKVLMVIDKYGITKLYFFQNYTNIDGTGYSVLLKSGSSTSTSNASFSPDGKLLTVDNDNKARIWDVNNLNLGTEWQTSTRGITLNEELPTWIQIVDKKLKSLKLTQSEIEFKQSIFFNDCK